jgi:hypothetical protein
VKETEAIWPLVLPLRDVVALLQAQGDDAMRWYLKHRAPGWKETDSWICLLDREGVIIVHLSRPRQNDA